MKIFVLRHGQAEPQKTTDEARNLTETGRADVASSIRYSLTDLMSVNEIWASPLVRAQQTAKIAQSILLQQGVSVAIKTTRLIEPEGHPLGLFELLQGTNLDGVLLASHMPFVGDFLDVFCGAVRGSHSMNTSSLALVECDIAAADLGKLSWLRHVHA